MNEYFASPTVDESVLTLSVDDFSSHISVVNINAMAPKLNFHFHPVSEAHVSDILSNLKIRKSTGPDGRYHLSCLK